MSGRKAPRVALLVIAGLFVLPLALAWLMYSGAIDWQPASTRNLGYLVQPPLPVSWDGVVMEEPPGSPAERFAGHWLVLYEVPDSCDDACLEAVVGLRAQHGEPLVREVDRGEGREDNARARLDPSPAALARTSELKGFSRRSTAAAGRPPNR